MSGDIEEIEENFAFLEDWEDRYRYVIELGRELEPLPAEAHIPENKVRGCSSQVWFVAQKKEGGALHFMGDSDAHIVKGLIAILFAIFNDKTPDKIGEIDAEARLEKLDLAAHLSPTRTNGLYAMVSRIKAMAAAA